MKKLLFLLFSFMLFSSCYDDEIRRLEERVDSLEARIESLEELTEKLNTAITEGKIIEKIEPLTSDLSGWTMTFDDGTSLQVVSPTSALLPLFRIDQNGNWLYSTDNGHTYVSLTDDDETMISSIGDGAQMIRLSDDSNGSYQIETYYPASPEKTIHIIPTIFEVTTNDIIKYVIFNDRRHSVALILQDGTEYVFSRSASHPSSIALLSVQSFSLAKGSQASVEFRVNPSTASLYLEEGEDLFELDCIGALTRSYVSPSSNVKLVKIEQVYDANNQLKQGQYRAIIEDCGREKEYAEMLSLVLTCQKGTTSEYQLSSSAFQVQSYSLSSIQTGLPILILNTPNSQSITSRDVWVEGATMTLLTPDGTIDYQGELSVKGRGNTSWGFAKKPYNIRLNKAAELLDLPSGKRWCLLANWPDRTMIRNAVGFEIARKTDLQWTPQGRFVELVLNGVHLGNYYLTEKIRIDSDRVNISNPSQSSSVIDRGYIFELDSYYNEINKFRSPFRDLPWQFKDPSNISEDQQSFIEQYVSDLELSLYDSARFANREFEEFIDLPSFADYWMVYEIAQCAEPNHPKSVYMYKDAGGKMVAGPVWDFDMSSFDLRTSYGFVDRDALYYEALFRDSLFCQLVRDRWERYLPSFRTIDTYIDSLFTLLSPSEAINYPMWPITIESNVAETQAPYYEALNRMKRAIAGKIEWMDNTISSNHLETSSKAAIFAP